MTMEKLHSLECLADHCEVTAVGDGLRDLIAEVWRLREALQEIREQYTMGGLLANRLRDCYCAAVGALDYDEMERIYGAANTDDISNPYAR